MGPERNLELCKVGGFALGGGGRHGQQHQLSLVVGQRREHAVHLRLEQYLLTLSTGYGSIGHTSSIGQHRRHAVHLRLGQHLLTGTRTLSSRGKIRNCLLSLQLFSHLSYETYESATLTSRTALWSLSLRTLFGHSHLSHYLASLTFLYYSHTLTSCTCQLSHSLARVSKHIAG